MQKALLFLLALLLVSCNDEKTFSQHELNEQLTVNTLYHIIKNNAVIQQMRGKKDTGQVFRENIRLLSSQMKKEEGFLGLLASDNAHTKICSEGYCNWSFSGLEYFKPTNYLKIAFGNLVVSNLQNNSTEVIANSSTPSPFIRVSVYLDENDDSGRNMITLFFDTSKISSVIYETKDYNNKVRAESSPGTDIYYEVEKQSDSLRLIAF